MKCKANRKKLKVSQERDATSCTFIPRDGDKSKLLRIFPAEIWEMILRHIKSPSDFEHLSNSSLYFRDYFLPRRKFFLFPSVWSVIQSRESDYQVGERNQILKYRQVCSLWNKAVENYFSKQSGSFLFTQSKSKYGRQEFGDSDDFIRFYRYFKSSDKVAVALGNSVILNLPIRLIFSTPVLNNLTNRLYSLELKMFLLKFDLFMFRFDHKVRCCTIKGSSSDIGNTLTWSDNFSRLTALNLEGTTFSNKDDKVDKISKLERLQYLNCRSLHATVFNKVIQFNQHITQLKVASGTGTYEIFSGNAQLPNLRILSIEIPSVECFQKLTQSGKSWNLEEIHFKIESGTGSHFEILESIQNCWRKTLSIVEIDLFNVSNMEENLVERSVDFKWEMENLKDVELKLSYLPCLDFLLPASTTLVNLKICGKSFEATSSARYIRHLARKQVVKSIGLMDKMHSSNVWKEFSNLEWLSLDCNDNIYNYRRKLCKH